MLTLCLSLAAVGCGAGLNAMGNSSFAIQAPADHLTTAAKLQFSVNNFSGRALGSGQALESGQALAVEWTVSGGDDETGPGTIDANGLYTPPAYLRASSVQVVVTAALTSDPATRSSQTITVSPAISVAPQNLALTPGAQTRLFASIAQVGSGAVQWSQQNAAGRFSSGHCQTSQSTFTQCSVIYTAPAALPANYANASLNASLKTAPASQASARLLLNSSAAASPLENEAPQTGADVLGTSGGNAHDSANQYCCGGTLGALLSIGGQPYVLSNNHVLARTDEAVPGDSILQPGLLDTDCGLQPSYTVATLSYAPRLQDASTKVDAAIAQAATGAFDPSGAILGFGSASNGTLANAAPARDPEDITRAGAPLPTVVKSGRTTGLTCGGISQIAVDFNVRYNTACDGSGDEFTKLFTNQIAISGAAFADSGDSGALLADQQTAQPVGLLFAGNSTETFANPIEDVLRSVAGYAAQQNPNDVSVEFVGGDHHPVTCLQYDGHSTAPTPSPVSAARMEAAQEVITRLRSALLASNAGILEVAAGASLDAPGQPAIVVYMDASRATEPVPAVLEGLRTVVVPTTPAELAAGHEPQTPASNADLAILPRSLVDVAIAVKDRYSASLRRDPAIFGVGVGKSMDDPSQAAIVIFVDRTQTPRSMPAQLGGLRVQYLFQDAPRAFDWKHNSNPTERRASCSLRSSSELDLNLR